MVGNRVFRGRTCNAGVLIDSGGSRLSAHCPVSPAQQPILNRFFFTKSFFWVVALAVSLLPACKPPAPTGPAVGEVFPELALERLDGETATPGSFRGKVLVLNVWGTWCPPCRKEMPSLERLSRKVNAERIAVIGLATDTDPNLVREFLLQYRIDFPMFMDPDRALATGVLRVKAFPETFVVGPDGRLLARVTGGRDWDSPEIIAALEEAARGGRPLLDLNQGGR